MCVHLTTTPPPNYIYNPTQHKRHPPILSSPAPPPHTHPPPHNHSTSYSTVTQSRDALPPVVGARVWVCQYMPAMSAYTPLYVSTPDLPESYTTGSLFKVRKCELACQLASRFTSLCVVPFCVFLLATTRPPPRASVRAHNPPPHPPPKPNKQTNPKTTKPTVHQGLQLLGRRHRGQLGLALLPLHPPGRGGGAGARRAPLGGGHGGGGDAGLWVWV